jgi:hypothetical protein
MDNNLDKSLSNIVSPYDEVEKTQEETTTASLLTYKENELVRSLSELDTKPIFDLFFDEVYNNLDPVEKKQFLDRCVRSLSDNYDMQVLYDFIVRDSWIEIGPDLIVNFIKFFVYDEWLYTLVKHLPELPLNVVANKVRLLDFIRLNYSDIRKNIIGDNLLNLCVKYHFNFATPQSGVKTLFKLIWKDIAGVISAQMVKRTGEKKNDNNQEAGQGVQSTK